MGEQFRESPPRINTLESPLYIDISRHLRQAVQILFRDEIFLPKMVSLPKLANCCACISLKTGTLIIGFLNLIGSLIFIPVSIALMAGKDAFVDQMRQMLGQSAHYDRQTIATGILIAGLILFVCAIIATIISSCLAHGARTRNISLMKPWIVLTAIGLVLNIISMALSLFVNPLSAVTSMAPWALNTCFFLVVLSFKKEIEAGMGAGEVVKA